MQNQFPDDRTSPRAGAVRASDLRGAARLATDATRGLTDLVEAVHARIARPPGWAGPADGRTSGITGLVYKSIRGVTRLVGGSVDALLGLLTPALADGPEASAPHAEREAVIATLNGVLGDHLEASANPLAITMCWRVDGRPLPMEAAALAARLPQATPRLLLLVHGLCMNDSQWRRDGHDHGAMLAADGAWTSVYLHYNSGLPVAANGRLLADQIAALVDAWPQPLERLAAIGHSMGGLLLRSAIHQARLAGMQWPDQLGDLVCLGTPHHGAPLERAGHWVDILLGAAPYAAPFARLGRVRSAGITDLRHGAVLAGGAHLPLPEGVRCWAIAGSTGEKEKDIKDRLLGDGLVPLASALGRHKSAAKTLAFAPERQAVVFGCGHLALLNRPEVAAQLQRWLGQ